MSGSHGATKGEVDRLQNGESSVILVGDQSEILAHPIDSSVGYVDPVQESEDEQHTEDGDDLDINLSDQRRFVDIWEHPLRGGLSSTPERGGLPVGRESWKHANVNCA